MRLNLVNLSTILRTISLKRQIINILSCTALSVCRLLSRHWSVIRWRHNTGGWSLNSLLFCYNSPCAHIGVPSAVVLSGFNINGYIVLRTHSKSSHLLRFIKEYHAYFSWILRLCFLVKYYLLSLPCATSRLSACRFYSLQQRYNKKKRLPNCLTVFRCSKLRIKPQSWSYDAP